jgi:subtilisin-like proprotein convertase family protein
MSKKSLAEVLRRWVARGARPGSPRPTARLRLEEVEQRLVPATTPEVVAASTGAVPNTTGAFQPQVAVDPTNPNIMAMAAAQPNGILVQVSFDGGATWLKMRDTNSAFNANANVSNIPQTFGADTSRGKLLDPSLPIGNIPSFQRGYTNASAPSIAFSRSGSVYVAYLEHNASKTSGALLVERFDIDRQNMTFTQYDLDPTRDWDNNPNTPANERWATASLGDNKAAVITQWIDDGVTTNRPLNPFIAVDTNRGTFTDPDTNIKYTDPFINESNAGGAETVFLVWNTDATAPTVSGHQNFLPGGLNYNPNAVFMAVGRLDPDALLDRANPNAPESPSNPRLPSFQWSTPVPINDGGNVGSAVFPSGGHFLWAPNLNTGGSAPSIAFSPAGAEAGGVPLPAQMSVVWQTTGGRLIQSSIPLGVRDATDPLRPYKPASSSITFRSNDDPTNNSGDNSDTNINDAIVPTSGDDIASVTRFELPVDLSATLYPNFGRLSDIDVSLALTHNRLQDLLIQLVAPDGTTVTLVQNGILSNGNNRPNPGVAFGLTGTDLGVSQGIVRTAGNPGTIGNPVGTTFSQEAPREIYNPGNPANYTGTFRPETTGLTLTSFYGQTGAQLSSTAPNPGLPANPTGNWVLQITDFRGDRIANNQPIPARFLRFWSISFTSRLDNSDDADAISNPNPAAPATPGRMGQDRFVTGANSTAEVPSNLPGAGQPNVINTVGFGADQTYQLLPAASPTFGVGAGVSIAYDTTLGSYSRFAGRLYMAYTAPNPLSAGDTNIYLLASDDNGLSWFRPQGTGLLSSASATGIVPIPVNDDDANDNSSEGRRTQYMPTVAVDPATGTVVVSWFDARNDANNSRVAVYVATSIDGGATFSRGASVSPEKFAIDAITGNRVGLEPVPTNVGAATTINPGASQYGGTGIRQALVVNGGVIRPFWAGNLNAAGSTVLSALVRTAAGPRVVGGDMGVISEQMVDVSAAGVLIQNGAVLVRDENNVEQMITDAFGTPRWQYNDTFAPDGTRLIDGFRVVFDRPVYFDPSSVNNPLGADPEGFDRRDVIVRFRGTTGLLDTGTQGASVPIRGVVPISTITLGNGATFATAFFVQFETPQSAVGTYSYAVTPGVSDRLRSFTTASYGSADTPLTLKDPGVVESKITVSPEAVASLPSVDQLVQNLRVGLNITHNRTTDLRVTLIGPDGTALVLADQVGGTNTANYVNTRFDDASVRTLPGDTNPFTSFNAIYQPMGAGGLAVFNGKALAGTWTLRIEDFSDAPAAGGSGNGGTGTLDGWSLSFRDATGALVAFPRRDGNGLDQDADGIQQEADNDVFSNPGSSSGSPFSGPFNSDTRPLVLPGAHVVRTYVPGQQAAQVSAVISNGSQLHLDVTLDREVDASTLTLAAIGSVTGPNGPLTPTNILFVAGDVVNGGTKKFQLAFASNLTPGQYLVTLNDRAFVTDDMVQNGATNTIFVRFDRDINPDSFKPANVLRMTGPTGSLPLTGVTVTAVADDRQPLAPGATTARLFRVTFDQPQLVTTQAANFTEVNITLSVVPTGGTLTLADILKVTGPSGLVSMTGATLTGSGTSYLLRFPTAPAGTTVRPAGQYVIDFTPAAARNIAVAGSGLRLSGAYSIEFGSDPTVLDPVAAAIRAADRPQLVTALTASTDKITIQLSTPPTGAALGMPDVVRVVGPNGLVDLTGATMSLVGGAYVLDFPANLPAGQYVIDFDPSAGRNIRVANSGLPVDNNLNAGLDLVLGRGTPTSGAPIATVNLPGPSTFLDVTFSSVIPGGLQAADVQRITGPNGIIQQSPLQPPQSIGGNSYRIFLGDGVTLQPAGQYTVSFDPSATRNIQVGNGQSVPVVSQVYPSASAPVPILPGTSATNDNGTPDPTDDFIVVTPTVTEMAITITDDFTITQNDLNRVEVLLNISHPNVRNLEIELVPPDASLLQPILLFRGVDANPFQSGRTANFNNTRLVDRLDDPNFPSILLSQPDYNAGAGRGFSPQTPLSDLVGKAVSAKGVWKLRVTNRGENVVPPGTSFPAGTPIQISNWQLTLPRAVPGSGTGERVADRFTAGFRVFTLDPTNELSRDAWTPVGPASANETNNTGNVTAVAVDPSDPSGNTVYVAGASGGVWKTTNFMTNDVDGPQFVPLTDFGPTTSLNVQSITLFPRNNDPSQTIVFALTGEGNNIPSSQTSVGVGLLRSTDGGRTWKVLDSTNNQSSDPNAVPGTVGGVSDPGRDRRFVGASGFKVVVDPNLTPEGGVIVYMAVSGAAAQAGVWRSRDGGLTWQLIRAGQATDVTLGAGSANTADPITQQTVNNGNLQRLYAAFRGDGVYFTDSAPSAASLSLMSGLGGLPSVRDFSAGAPFGGFTVGVQNTPSPNGGQGRITLAAPALTNDPVRNSFYKDWLYAVVSSPAGQMVGLFQTKDAGKNWVQVQIPLVVNPNSALTAYPTNNEALGDHDPLANPNGANPQANYSVSLTVDPLNPNVVYLAGLGDNSVLAPVGGSIKLDLTTIKDTQNFTNFNNSDPAGGVQTGTTGGLTQRNPTNAIVGRVFRGGRSNTYGTDFLNVSRDPDSPFLTNSTVRTLDVLSLTNDGSDIKWQPFNDVLSSGVIRAGEAFNERLPTVNVHSIFPLVDPITGRTRFIYGNDQGVYTGVDRGDGQLTPNLGFDRLPTGSRNGNLQLTQFLSGSVQPSQLAADIAGSLFYGAALINGTPVGSSRLLESGDVNWRGPAGSAGWTEVDPTGSGTAYQYRFPCCFGLDNNTTATANDFFRVLLPNTDHEFGGGIGRTFGLLQAGDSPGQNQGQWRSVDAYPFAVNPVNPNALVIASSVGRVFRTTDRGNTWIPIAEPGTFAAPGQTGSGVDGTGPGAVAFGAAASATTLTNNFIYAGTTGGRIFVTTTGGGQWGNISAGLDGATVVRIVPNPATGSREVYAVTTSGVFYKADGTDLATPWTSVTGNLFSLTRAVFGDTQDQDRALQYINVLAVDWRFNNPVTGGAAGQSPPLTAPDLYVGGMGGVFKSSDFGRTWALYPAIANTGAVSDGGNLPNVEVTDLDLSIGNLNPSSGEYQPGGLNLLLATTFGRGSWAIRLADTLPPESFVSGPAVTSVINLNPSGGPSSSLQVQFSSPVDPATIRPENFRLERIGTPDVNVPILSVVQVATPGVQNRYQINFQTQTGAAAQYRLTVGYNSPSDKTPTITDPSGFRMNQNGDLVNGQPEVDQYTTTLTLNGQNNSLAVVSAPVTLVAGSTGAVRIEVRDSNGVLQTTQNGTLAITSPGNSFQLLNMAGQPITSVQVVNGVATFQVRMTTAAVYTFSATFTPSGSLPANSTSFTTTVTAAAAATIDLNPSAATVTAGTPVTYTAEFRDQYGNPTTYTGAVNITYAGLPVSGPATVNVNNLASATFVVATAQASATQQAFVTATLAAPAPSGTPTATAAITVNAGTGTGVTVTPSGTGPFVVGTPVTVTVRVTDPNGNPSAVNGPFTINVGGDPGAVVTPASPQLVNGVATFTVRYSTPGTYTIVATVGALSGASAPITISAQPPRPNPTDTLTGTFAAATGIAGNPSVQVFQANGQLLTSLTPFPAGFAGEVDPGSAGFTGGIRMSVADVTGDGVADYVMGTGPTITATVVVVNGATGQTVLTLRPFADFKGGVFVSTGDLDGDGVNEIVITPDEGGGPRVTILRGRTFSQMANFFGINDPNFRGGARAAMGDVNGDGFADVVVSAGFGGGPRISIYDGAALLRNQFLNVVGDFFLFEPALRNGAYVAVGDVNGDGLADLIGGAGPGGGPRVMVLDSATLLSRGTQPALDAPLFNAFLGDINNRGGVRVAAKNLNNDAFTDILIGSGEGGGSQVASFSGADFSPIQAFDLLPGYTGGVFVG